MLQKSHSSVDRVIAFAFAKCKRTFTSDIILPVDLVTFHTVITRQILFNKYLQVLGEYLVTQCVVFVNIKCFLFVIYLSVTSNGCHLLSSLLCVVFFF